MNNETTTEQEEKFPGFVTPTKNFFHMPNCWLDICADINNLAELKVVQYVLRHTWGFHEYGIAKAITIDEFMSGRKRSDGTRIDKGTGLAKKSVIDGLQKAINHHYLECEIDDADKGRIKKSYKLKMLKASTDEPDVQILNICGSRPEHLDTTSLTSEVQEVNSRVLDTEHRTEKDTLERHPRKTPKKEDSAALADSSSTNVTALFAPSSEGEEKKPTKKGSSAKKDERKAQVEEMYALFDRLYQEMSGDPEFKAPRTKKNTEAIESLIVANATPEKIRFVFQDIWNDGDIFWRNHRTITSVCSQYGTRVSKMKRAPMPSSNGTSHSPSPSPETYITDYQRKYREKAAKFEHKEAK